MQDLDAVLPLALFLAHERNKGQNSFWQPYLGLLPEQPGCAWLMPPAQLSEALKAVKQLVGRLCHPCKCVFSVHFLTAPCAHCLTAVLMSAITTTSLMWTNVDCDEAVISKQVLLPYSISFDSGTPLYVSAVESCIAQQNCIPCTAHYTVPVCLWGYAQANLPDLLP